MVSSADHKEGRVGIEICSTTIGAVLMDGGDEVRLARNVLIRSDVSLIDQLADLIGGLRAERLEFNSVGVAVPGLVDRLTNSVAYSANMPENVTLDLAGNLRAAAEVEADEWALRLRQEELESHLVAVPATSWADVAEKACYLLKLFAATPAAQHPRRQTLITNVLDEFARLACAAEENSH